MNATPDRKTILGITLVLLSLLGMCWELHGRTSKPRHSAPPVAGQPTVEQIAGDDFLCGPHSVTGAAARLGIWIDTKKIAAQCPITSQGFSMLELKHAASQFSLEVQGARLTWEQLVKLDRPAVLSWFPNHYVFVDSREQTSEGSTKRIRLYDYPDSARWVSADDLKDKWHGEALLIGKPSRTTAALAFDTLLADFGEAYASDAPAHIFHFRNMGAGSLKILDVQKSCGCTQAVLSKSELKSGEEGTLTVSIDLHGRQGVQRQVVFLKTTDSALPVIPLSFQGATLNPVHISTDMINLGQICPGQQLNYDFVVTDRNRGSLLLTSYDYATSTAQAQAERLVVKAGWSKTSSSYDEMQKAHQEILPMEPILRGRGQVHYLVSLAVTVPSTANPGLGQGVLVLTTNDPRNPKINLPLVYQVTSNLNLTPDEVSFGIVHSYQKIRKTLSLTCLNNQLDGLGEAQADVIESTGELLPRVRLHRKSDKSMEIEMILDLSTNPTRLKSGFYQGSIRIRMPQGSLCVPWKCIVKQA